MVYIVRGATREEWLRARREGIGSSEAGAVLGVSHFATPWEVWDAKVNGTAVAENAAMRMGHKLEGVVAELFEERTGLEVDPRSAGDWLAVDEARPWLRVSPDREYWLADGCGHRTGRGILECKTTQMPIDPDDLPKAWYCQLQYQLGVMGYKEGHLAWLTRGRDFDCARVTFDADFYGYLTAQLTAFWKGNVLERRQPDVRTVADARAKWPVAEPGKTKCAAPADVEAVREYARKSAEMRRLQGELDALKARVIDAVGDAEALTLADERTLATYRQQTAERVDVKRLRELHPDVAAECVTTSTARVLRVKYSED